MPAGNNHTASPCQPEALSTDAIPLLRSLPTATAWYAGSWDDADCAAHHQDSLARYFHFTVSEQKLVTIELSAGALHVSQGTPTNGWGTAPNGTYEQRREVRRTNGKLLHDSPHVATPENDGHTVTLALTAGETYTAEAVGTSGYFNISITPQ